MSLFLYQTCRRIFILCRIEILVIFATIGEKENFLRYIPRTVMCGNVIVYTGLCGQHVFASIKFITLSMCEMVMPNNQSIGLLQDRKYRLTDF